MAGAVNIVFGAVTSGFNSNVREMGGTVKDFTTNTRAQFDTLKNLGAVPSNSLNKFRSDLAGTSKGVKPFLSEIGKLGSITSSLGPLSGALGGFFAVDKVLGFGTAITSTSGKFEKFQSILTNALQSGSGAKSSLGVLANFAAETPNQLDELTGSFIKFVNRGLVPTKAQLTNFGDLAASQGKGFDQLTEAILDAQSGEFERLKEFGIRASKSGDTVTLAFKGVTQTVKNTSEDITGAIQKFGQLTGVVGSMSAVAQTQEGQLSNLGDQYDRLLVALGDKGVSGGFKLAIGAASTFLGLITDLIATSPVQELRNQQTELNSLVGAIALASDNEAVRLSLIQKLNQSYPEFLGKLDAESATTDLLSRRLADVNAQYDRKIRIALGEEKIKKSTEDLTKSIRVQEDALGLLAKASGKSLIELERLGSRGQIALAKQLAQSKQLTEFRPSYFGQSAAAPTDFLVSMLEGGAAAQKKAQGELNKLMGDNAARQADLTKTTVEGYQAQITQIRQKIKLHQIDAKLGTDEITRLNDQIRSVQGLAPVKIKGTSGSAYDTLKADVDAASDKIKEYVAKNGVNAKIPLSLQLDYKNKAAALKAAEDAVKDITPKTPKVTQTVSIQATGDLSILKRYAADLETTIQNLGGKAPEKLLAQLNDARSAIERLQALTAKDQKITIPDLQDIIGPGTKERVAAIVGQMGSLGKLLPELTGKPLFGLQLTDLQKLMPSVDFYQSKISAIGEDIKNITLKGLAVPAEATASLAKYIEALNAANRAEQNAMTQAGVDAENSRLDSLPTVANFGFFKVVDDSKDKMVDTLKDMNAGIGQTLKEGAVTALTGMGEIIGGLLAGTAGLDSIPNLLLSTLGGMLKQLGTIALEAAIGLTAIQVAFKTLNPVVAAVAGVGLIALGAAIQSGVKKIGNYEGGGLFTGESVIRVGESARAIAGGGEFVAPVALGANLIGDRILSKINLKTPEIKAMNYEKQAVNVNLNGEFELSGHKLRLALNRADESNYDFV